VAFQQKGTVECFEAEAAQCGRIRDEWQSSCSVFLHVNARKANGIARLRQVRRTAIVKKCMGRRTSDVGHAPRALNSNA